ncbi:MAG: hypothetical protein, partial [Olavius algarvensis Delta 4 endosymbiont]
CLLTALPSGRGSDRGHHTGSNPSAIGCYLKKLFSLFTC